MFLRQIPAVLASLVLAAHFLRRGQLIPVLLCLGLVALASVRARWARRVWQACLGAGVLVWLGTVRALVRERVQAGEPWERSATILAGVAVFTLLAAVLLEYPRVRARGVDHAGGPPGE